mgnify:FL=1
MSLLKLDPYLAPLENPKRPSRIVHDAGGTHKGIGREVAGDKKKYHPRLQQEIYYDSERMRMVVVREWVEYVFK